MKKLMILMLVLAVAGLANAALVIIDNADGTVGIETTVQINAGGGLETYWALVSASSTPTGGALQAPYAGDAAFGGSIIFDGAVAAGVPGLGAGEDGVYGGVWTTGGPFTASSMIFDGISGLSVGDVVKLYTTDFSASSLVDTVTIVPEPMTIALLGLGGLFIRRKK